MRVLHLLKTSVGATWALRQVRELAQLGVKVHVALPAGGPLVPHYQAAGVITHLEQFDLPTRQPGRWPGVCRALCNLVSCVQPDIIHSHFVGTTLTMRLALGKGHPTPRVFQVPGPLHLEHTLFGQAELWTAGPRDHWIGSCEWTCNRYRRARVPGHRLSLSYYGVDLDQFAQQQEGKLRKELQVDRNTRLVGMVAFMYAPKWVLGQRRGLKGHEDLIDALAICRRTRSDVVGVFIGGAWNGATAYERRVRAYAERQCGSAAVFLGTREDVPALYPDFDVAVHPSHSENVGGACESLLLGVPTIATNVGGFPDLVENQHTGWLVPPRDPQALAAAILEALEKRDHARSLAMRGQERARCMFDVKSTASQVFRIYQEILEESPCGRE